MSAKQSPPWVNTCGDVTGVAFEGEDTVVLFLPNSGDVLISPIDQWQQLVASGPSIAPTLAADLSPISDATGLISTLIHIGAKID